MRRVCVAAAITALVLGVMVAPVSVSAHPHGAYDEVIVGTSGNDNLNGTEGRDKISGLAGSDKLFGGKGRDLLRGGSGADSLRGGNLHDELRGGVGNDKLTGGRGGDVLFGGAGSDRLTTSIAARARLIAPSSMLATSSPAAKPSRWSASSVLPFATPPGPSAGVGPGGRSRAQVCQYSRVDQVAWCACSVSALA